MPTLFALSTVMFLATSTFAAMAVPLAPPITFSAAFCTVAVLLRSILGPLAYLFGEREFEDLTLNKLLNGSKT